MFAIVIPKAEGLALTLVSVRRERRTLDAYGMRYHKVHASSFARLQVSPTEASGLVCGLSPVDALLVLDGSTPLRCRIAFVSDDQARSLVDFGLSRRAPRLGRSA